MVVRHGAGSGDSGRLMAQSGARAAAAPPALPNDWSIPV